MSLAINGRMAADARPEPPSPIMLRRANISDANQMAVAAKAYFNSPLTKWLAPHREKYYSDYMRVCINRVRTRMLDPRSITVVACEASNPSRVIGYAQFVRLGDDEGAKKQIASRKSIHLFLLSWFFWFWTKIVTFVLGADKSADPDAMRTFESWIKSDNHIWDKPERKNRWHAESVAVSQEFQRRGIGRRLMKEAIAWAEAENVVLGLESSEEGEGMYRSVGFDLLARFEHHVVGENRNGGGFMLYTPLAMRAKDSF